MTKKLDEERAETLARRVWTALEEGEQTARLTNGRDFKKRRWEQAHAALFELLRRSKAS